MFGITTFMFALGIIALVLETTLGFQLVQYMSDPLTNNTGPSYQVRYYIWAATTCLMVRFHDALMPSA